MKNRARTGIDPLPFVLAGLLALATLAGGVAAFTRGFAGAAVA